MPAPFKKLTLEQFSALLERFPFTRKINAVHMHHTWRPNHRQFKGHDSIVAMWAYHTQHNKWSDIAQHITIDPMGFIWIGRNWNAPPASSSGQNGNASAGPFMFEMIGDFDQGRDPFGGEQRKTALSVVARVQRRFGLRPGSLMFHNMMSGKSCPGSSIDYQTTLDDIQQLHADMASRSQESRSAPFPPETFESEPTVEEALEDLSRVPANRLDPADAEPCSQMRADEFVDDFTAPCANGYDGTAARAAGPSPGQLLGLRPHLINLTMGEFSTEGAWKSSRGDVDAIFDEDLPLALKRAQEQGTPLRIVIQAHGGLVSESAGIAIAQKSVDWWTANNIYPLYFVWETGAFETIGQLLRRARDAVGLPRDVFDLTTDPLIQETARALQGPSIWGGMKLSAQLASSSNTVGNSADEKPGAEGGAHYVAQKLAEFCDKHGAKVELHAVGHSAGAIFHSYFIPCALLLGVPGFRSVHFLAPAVRADLFKATLADRIGPRKGIDKITLYTMRKDYEADDNCAKVYRKSLLYLIYHALEPQRKTPILGLEESLRGDRDLMNMFGLRGTPADGDVVWSRTTAQQGRSASTSTSHGGFDDDGPTMSSIARRILGKADADRIVEYVTGTGRTRAGDPWSDEIDLPPEIRIRPVHRPEPAGPARGNGSQNHTGPAAPQHNFNPTSGRRRALCVGINRYPTAPLGGCIADVQSWTRSLNKLGFSDIRSLLDERATRDAIVEQLEQLTQTSNPGDVIVFQYSGHGTQVPDLDNDEADGDTPGLDEAICPFDFASGAFLIDDDIGRIFNQLPNGVNLTCFMDCCHSGTISRFGMGLNPLASAHTRNERARFVVAGPELEEAHRRYRQAMQGSRAVARGRSLMREVVFCAAMSHELAWESDGQGEFTVRATRVLDRGAGNLTNAQFAELVTMEFGPSPRQQARLYSNSEATGLPLLQPLMAHHASAAFAEPMRGGDGSDFLLHGMKQLIQQYERH